VGELLDTWQRARNLAQQAEEKLQRAEFAQGKINFVGVVPRPEGP
jgi:exonuclease VII small subunit